MDELKQIIKENLKTAPPQIRAMALGDDISTCVASMASRRNLDETDSVVIRNAALFVLGNILPPHELKNHLESVLSLSPSVAGDIAEELDMKVFAKVRAELDTLYKKYTPEETPSSSLPLPPPPPPGARRSIPTRDLLTSPKTTQPVNKLNTPSYRPIQPVPQTVIPKPIPPAPVPPSVILQAKKPEDSYLIAPPPSNLPTIPSSTTNKSPFNTPNILNPIQKPTVNNNHPQVPKPTTPTDPINDILSAKLGGIVQATNDEHILGSTPKSSNSYGKIDPYREPAE